MREDEMSAELVDVRGKVTRLGHCALIAHARANDLDVSEIIRDLVEQWARKQAHAASVLHACMKAKGVTAADAGIAGKLGETPLDWEA